ncbi:MAG: galactose-1-phosphate uridylyltransferase [Bacteroidales bacterium]|nr:galactose-1-phosphate uridylyltransferase [Bacteroidales bacterium]
MNLVGKWERRWHPLLQEWVILAAVTSERPWSGETVKASEAAEPEFDPKCYLCPGVVRASGIKNPEYTGPWAFTNDFASFSFDAPDVYSDSRFQKVEPVHGTCRVICYTPKHNATLADLPLDEVEAVVRLWKTEYETLSKNEKIENVLIFENKGKVIGVSNPHPHGQIYATNFVPRIVERQRNSFASYFREHGSHLLEDLLHEELQYGKRIVYQNEHFVAFVPFFARFVYETYIVPRKQVSHIGLLSENEIKSLAEIHKTMLTKFDRLYQMSFPNITMLQNAPCDHNPDNQLFHFHIEFYPPLRSPDKMKYLAGFESGGGNIINPVMPDEAAQRLRDA